MKTKLKMLAAGLVLGVFSGGAQATVGYCSSGAATGMSTADVTFEGNNATDCYGILSGNDSLTDINSIVDGVGGAGLWGAGWVGGVTSNAIGDPPSGGTPTSALITVGLTDYTFTLSYNVTADAGGATPESGDWFVTIAPAPGAGSTFYFDFAVALKGATDYGYYFFDEAAVTEATSEGTYTFKLAQNKNGGYQALSHLSLYVRDGDTPDIPANGRIPEPGMLSLLGVGLLGQAWLLRRRRQQQK